MNRRDFHELASMGIIGSLLASTSKCPAASLKADSDIIKPQRLLPGDKVGLITPGSYVPDAGYEKAVNNLTQLGLQVVPGKYVREKRGFTAGTDEQRLEDLHTFFEDPSIKAIWCARGGYGCSRLLPNINYELIKNNPKILIGYSDITALLQAIFLRTGLVGFHGPVAAATWTPYTLQHIKGVLFDSFTKPYVINLATEELTPEREHFKPYSIQAGKVSGRLMGGNVSLLAALAGTPFAFDATDKLLFMEDIDERPYSLDRMFTQLRQSANLHKAKGLILGVFEGCNPKKDEESLSLKETIFDRLSDLNVPAVYGLSFGHVPNNFTLPVGILAELDTENKTLTYLESPTA
jgi:muramoyltetrapeptide carboxypeptidase